MRKLLTVMTALLMSLLNLPGLCGSRALAVETETIWVVCQPDSSVNIRSKASGRSEQVGYALPGDDFQTDGEKKNGFLHIFAPIEAMEGWISLGYVVWEEPEKVYEVREIEASGRVAARRTIDGKRRRWLKPGDTVTVYYIAEWCVTSAGFVRWEYLGGVIE